MRFGCILALLMILCLSSVVGQDNEAAYWSRDRYEVRPVVAPVIAAHSGKSVLFAMPSPNGCILFARDSITVVLEAKRSIAAAKAVSEIANGDDFHALLKPQERELLADRRALAVSKPVMVRIAFVDANHDVKVEALGKQTAEVHSVIGSDQSKWKTSEPVFTGVAYRNLWPGIDLSFKGEAGKITCMLQVSADADPSKVRMEYRGLTGMKKGEMGEWLMETPVGNYTNDRPEAYQPSDGKQVALYGEFAQDGDHLKLDIRDMRSPRRSRRSGRADSSPSSLADGLWTAAAVSWLTQKTTGM